MLILLSYLDVQIGRYVTLHLSTLNHIQAVCTIEQILSTIGHSETLKQPKIVELASNKKILAKFTLK